MMKTECVIEEIPKIEIVPIHGMAESIPQIENRYVNEVKPDFDIVSYKPEYQGKCPKCGNPIIFEYHSTTGLQCVGCGSIIRFFIGK